MFGDANDTKTLKNSPKVIPKLLEFKIQTLVQEINPKVDELLDDFNR